MRISTLFILLLLLPFDVHAFRMSGHLKNLFVYTDDEPTDLNRIRLDLYDTPTDNLSLRVVVDQETLLGHIPRKFRVSDELEATLVEEKNLFSHISVYRLYLTFSYNDTQLKAGRQRIVWGNAKIWNLLDIFKPVSPFSIEREEKEGTDAIRIEHFTGPLSSIGGVFAEGGSTVAFGRTNLRGYDLTAIGGLVSGRGIVAFEMAGALKGAGIYGGISLREGGENSVLIGLDYLFQGKLYSLIEYFNDSEDSTNSLGIELSYDIHPLVRLVDLCIWDIEKKTLMLHPYLSYNLLENADLTIGTILFTRRTDNRTNIAYLSLNVYF